MEVKAETYKEIFNTLNDIDLKGKVKEKMGLSYLSWAYAWGVLKQNYPTAKMNIYERKVDVKKTITHKYEDGTEEVEEISYTNEVPYFTDGMTAFVKVGVDINGIEYVEQLPVMNNKNQSVSLSLLKMTDVNKAIQLWKKAAEKEDPRALFDYGVCLGIGVGDVERQAEHSIECIHKALDKVLFAAKTGDRDGVLMAARCGLMGIIISTFNDLEPDGDMLIYANDFSEAAAEDGNIYARVIQYFLISNSIAIMDDEEVDVDILLKDIEDNISHSPIYADALMLLGGLCEEELNKEQVKRVIQLAQKAVKNHLYSNDLLTISMVASMVGDNNIDYKDDLVSYYVNLD